MHTYFPLCTHQLSRKGGKYRGTDGKSWYCYSDKHSATIRCGF